VNRIVPGVIQGLGVTGSAFARQHVEDAAAIMRHDQKEV
jgi:hypothetical protein